MWATILALAIKYAPDLIASVIAEFQKTNPTVADWNALFSGAITKCNDFLAKEQAALAALTAKPAA